MLRRKGEPVVFVHLRVEEPELHERMERRRQHEGHFMPPGLLRSQLETLEPPGPDEAAIEVEAGKADPPTVAATIAARLADWEPGHPTA
jgi:gluconate kinase